jgi:hypothetical protein
LIPHSLWIAVQIVSRNTFLTSSFYKSSLAFPSKAI